MSRHSEFGNTSIHWEIFGVSYLAPLDLFEQILVVPAVAIAVAVELANQNHKRVTYKERCGNNTETFINDNDTKLTEYLRFVNRINQF